MTQHTHGRRTGVRAIDLGAGDGVRLEAEWSDDAWIEADYREGWVGRKLMAEDSDAYAEMVSPYFLKCRCCREFKSPDLWGAGSPYCPHCEQIWHRIGDWFENTADGDLPKPSLCPECGSPDIDRPDFMDPYECAHCGATCDAGERAEGYVGAVCPACSSPNTVEHEGVDRCVDCGACCEVNGA